MSQRLPENNWSADLGRVTIVRATRNPPRDPNDDDDDEEEDDDEPGDDEPAVIREPDEDE